MSTHCSLALSKSTCNFKSRNEGFVYRVIKKEWHDRCCTTFLLLQTSVGQSESCHGFSGFVTEPEIRNSILRSSCSVIREILHLFSQLQSGLIGFKGSSGGVCLRAILGLYHTVYKLYSSPRILISSAPHPEPSKPEALKPASRLLMLLDQNANEAVENITNKLSGPGEF